LKASPLEEVDRLSTQPTLPRTDLRDISFPGEFPYSRHPCYRLAWQALVDAIHGFSTPKTLMLVSKYLLAEGGLSVAYDLLMGYDADSTPKVKLVSAEWRFRLWQTWKFLFDAIRWAGYRFWNDQRSRVGTFRCLVVAEKQKANWQKISGTLQNDIPRNTSLEGWDLPDPARLKLVIDTFAFCHACALGTIPYR